MRGAEPARQEQGTISQGSPNFKAGAGLEAQSEDTGGLRVA